MLPEHHLSVRVIAEDKYYNLSNICMTSNFGVGEESYKTHNIDTYFLIYLYPIITMACKYLVKIWLTNAN